VLLQASVAFSRLGLLDLMKGDCCCIDIHMISLYSLRFSQLSCSVQSLSFFSFPSMLRHGLCCCTLSFFPI
jgi:hypothetical protein